MKQYYQEQYTRCILSCPPSDVVCLSDCSRYYQQNVGGCPCQPGCPDGCPCSVYECPDNTEVLILNTREPYNAPIITSAFGIEERDFHFAFDKGTEVYHSCAVTWRNQQFIFGGYNEPNQIAKLESCRLTRIGTLPFDHNYGGCASVADNFVYLCFNDNAADIKMCRVALSPTDKFDFINPSQFDHRKTRVAANNGKK